MSDLIFFFFSNSVPVTVDARAIVNTYFNRYLNYLGKYIHIYETFAHVVHHLCHYRYLIAGVLRLHNAFTPFNLTEHKNKCTG